MRIVLVGLVVAACSHPAPPPAKVPTSNIARTPVSSVPTCADMGPLLRGPIDDEEVAGPKKEAVIVQSCVVDHWPPAVLSCVASATEPTVQDCLKQLPSEVQARFGKVTGGFDRAGDEHDEPPPPEMPTCAEALAATSVDLWPPAVGSESERKIAAKLRFEALLALCNDQHWEDAVKSCIKQTPTSGIDQCIGQLGASRSAEVTRVLDDTDKLRAKIVKATPASVTCEKVVAAHYSDAKLKGKEPELKGTARKNAIAMRRKAMLTQCKAGNWSVEARACIVVDDRDACYALPGVGHGPWGHALGSNTGIAECDAYREAIDELASCPSISDETRKTMVDAFDQAAEAWKVLTGADLEAARVACKAAADAVKQSAQGCT